MSALAPAPLAPTALPTPSLRMHALYRTHAPALLRFLTRLTMGKREAAEDLLQETLLRAWRKIDGLPAGDEALRAWLYTVARRVAIDAARARKAQPAITSDCDLARLPESSDTIERVMTVLSVRAALPQLSQAHRVVLIELYYNGRTHAEIAARLGVPAGTVRSRAHYAIRSLAVAIGATSKDVAAEGQSGAVRADPAMAPATAVA